MRFEVFEMEQHYNQNPVLARLLVKRGLFEREPFVLIDVGASGGLHSVWREFGSQLVAFCFDPQRSECRKLQEREANPRVTYVPRFVGLPESHPFVRRRRAQNPAIFQHFNPWNRLSAAYLRATDMMRLVAEPQSQ